MKGILWGLAIVVPMWAIILWVVVGCAPTPVTRYESAPNHYPYYRERVEQDHSRFVFGPDQSKNGFVSSDGTMIFGPERENQFIGGGE